MKAFLIFVGIALFLALFGGTIIGIAWWVIPSVPKL